MVYFVKFEVLGGFLINELKEIFVKSWFDLDKVFVRPDLVY